MSSRTRSPLPVPEARLAIVALLAAALVPAACSSGRDASDAGREGGADAAVEHPLDDGADASIDDDAAAMDAHDEASDADGAVPDADANDTDGGSADTAGDLAGDDGGGGDAHDASDGTAGGDGAEGAPGCATCSFYVVFALENEQVSFPGITQIRYVASYALDVFNGSDQVVSLANVKVRYWFTGDNTSWQWMCGANCAGVQGPSFVGIGARPGADTYLEVAFGSGHLDAFSDTGLIQQTLVGMNSAFVIPSIQNDYSFSRDPTMPDPRVTLYVGNKLVWGVEP